MHAVAEFELHDPLIHYTFILLLSMWAIEDHDYGYFHTMRLDQLSKESARFPCTVAVAIVSPARPMFALSIVICINTTGLLPLLEPMVVGSM